MKQPECFELAKQIVELDEKRDLLFEKLMTKADGKGYEWLRAVQNGWDPKEKK